AGGAGRDQARQARPSSRGRGARRPARARGDADRRFLGPHRGGGRRAVARAARLAGGPRTALRPLVSAGGLRPMGRAPATMDRDAAIGIFDSGVGGLTVLHAVLGVVPNEHLIYLGDTGRYPYGNRSAEIVTRYALESADFLVERKLKLLVIACNTATAAALDALRAHVPVPVIGVVDPGTRAAVPV